VGSKAFGGLNRRLKEKTAESRWFETTGQAPFGRAKAAYWKIKRPFPPPAAPAVRDSPARQDSGRTGRGTGACAGRAPEGSMHVLACLAEGLGMRATARVFAVAPNTVLHWLVEAAEQFTAFSAYCLCDLHALPGPVGAQPSWSPGRSRVARCGTSPDPWIRPE
jgi:hypothetical protein